MQEFRIQPGNPNDFTEEELGDLLKSVDDLNGAKVRLGKRDERGYGVTFYEVIQVVADIRAAGGDVVLGALLHCIVTWLKRRWQCDRDEHSGAPPRPRSIVLLDSKGNKIRTINIDEPDGEPQEEQCEEGID